MKISQEILWRLIEKKGSQSALARYLGISPSKVSTVKSGGRKWQFRELPLLADYLGIDVMDLLPPVHNRLDGSFQKVPRQVLDKELLHRCLVALDGVGAIKSDKQPDTDTVAELITRLYSKVIMDPEMPDSEMHREIAITLIDIRSVSQD